VRGFQSSENYEPPHPNPLPTGERGKLLIWIVVEAHQARLFWEAEIDEDAAGEECGEGIEFRLNSN